MYLFIHYLLDSKSYHKKVYQFIELFIKQEQTTNILTDSFLMFIIEYLELITKTDYGKELKEAYYIYFKEEIIKLISVINNKKIEYTNGVNDSLNLLHTCKIQALLLNICSSYVEIEILDTLNFIINNIQIVFNLTKQTNTDSMFEILVSIIKDIVIKNNSDNNSNTTTKIISIFQVISIMTSFTNKTLEIATNKDILKETLDYTTQSHMVTSLVNYLKCINILGKGFFNNEEFYSKCTKSVISLICSLSFWENCSVMDQTAQLILVYWNTKVNNYDYNKNNSKNSSSSNSITHSNPDLPTNIKFNIEIIIEYFFNKKLKEYYNYFNKIYGSNKNVTVEEEEEHLADIVSKQAGLELVMTYLSYFCLENLFLKTIYTNFDLLKIGNCLLFEILSNMNKFYSLYHSRFSFIQNIISVVTENILDFIYQMNIENNIKLGKSDLNERRNSNNDKKVSFNDSELSTALLEKNIKFWKEAVDVINLGKYKKLFAFVQEHFGVINTTAPKRKKIKKEDVEVQEVKTNNDNGTKNDQNIESKEKKDTNSENPNESSNSLSSLPNTNNSINKTYSTNSNLNSNNQENLSKDNTTTNTNTQDTVTLHKQKSQASLTSTTSSQSADTSKSQQNLQSSVIDESNLNKIKQRNREIAKLIAILLRYSQLINTNIIFEIIGMNDDFSGDVLSEYLNTFNFTNMDILSAYRLLISTFKLGGEAYILYNIIIEFSKKYFENNKGNSVFTSEDQVSTFAYSILMLNTDLHDPGVKEHMKVDDFIKNNHMTGLFNDIPHEYFRNIYKSIQTNPLKIAACRKNDYPKSEEVFDNLHSKNLFYNKNKKEILEIVNNRVLEDIDYTRNNENKESKENNDYFDSEILYDISSITREQFPYLLTIAKLNNNPHSKLHFSNSDIEMNSSDSLLSTINKNEVLISKLFFEDFFHEFNNISNNFYNMNIEMSEKIIKKMCELSSIHNKPEYIEKLLINITKLISSKDTSTNKLNIYNLYFLISINYVDKLSSYIEVFFNNLIEFIKLNINNQITAKNAEMSINSVGNSLINNTTTDSNNSSTNTLIRKELNVIEKCYSQLFKFDYLSLLDKVINYSYVILFKKKMMKNDSYFGFIFGSSAPSKDDYQRGLEQFRILMLKQLKLNYYTYNSNKENKENASSNENKLINSTTNKNNNSQTNTTSNVIISENYPQDKDKTETVKNQSNTTNTNANTKITNANKTPNLKEINDSLDVTLSNLSTLQTITKISKSSSSSEINIHNILSVIRSKEEDFLFFLNLASLKILEYKEFNEMFYSIIFLNEIIMEDLDEKEFLKIWHNLLNILHNKLDIKENFGEKENNVFEIVLINDLVTTIIAKHITYIESEDYFYFLEKYLEIENNDLIFIILENNDKIVKKSFSKNILIKEDIMETLLSLFLKYVTDANFNYSNNSNNSLNLEIQRMSLVIKYLTNLFKVLPSINFFSSDCVDLCVKIVKILKEKRVEKTLLFSLIKEIVKKIETSDISFSDTKWDLFMQLFNFILQAILIDNVKIQNDYLLLLCELINEVKIPMLKFKEIYTSLNIFYTNSINIRDKSVYYWERIFCLFNYIFKSNKELVNSDFDMENLWCLFIRKFLISFVDSKQYSKKKNINANANDKTDMSEEQIKSDERSLLLLGEIVDYVKGSSKCKIFNYFFIVIENISPPKWWESCKNTIVLYFPNLINKTLTNNNKNS